MHHVFIRIGVRYFFNWLGVELFIIFHYKSIYTYQNNLMTLMIVNSIYFIIPECLALKKYYWLLRKYLRLI